MKALNLIALPRRQVVLCSAVAMLSVPHFWIDAVELPPGFVADIIATNLNAATACVPLPDGRVFITDQTGRVLVWKSDRLLKQPALTLHVSDFWERGLIGMTLDPAFPRPPHAFVLYVTDRPTIHHVISRFTVIGDVFDSSSEKILLEGDDQAKLGGSVPAGHQGGPLRFGPDGKLYVSLGEQTAGEPAQRLDTLQGKILRLNPDGTIPEDNPFVARTRGKYRSIYALGVRNSFGLAVQPKAGGRVFFTDVGGSAFEEINELKAGGNYGWPSAEGFSTNILFVNPLHAYPPLVGQSIVGGAFVPAGDFGGGGFPSKWRGKLLFADFMKHWIKAIDVDAPTNILTFARGLNGPVALEFAADGSLLVLNRGAIWRDPKKFVPNAGSLLRIRYTGQLGEQSGGRALARQPDPFTPALGLPVDPANLPRRLSHADWMNRMGIGQARSFGVSDLEWCPPAAATLRVYLPSKGVLRIAAGEVTFPAGTVFVREFSVQSAGGRGDTQFKLWKFERRIQVIGMPRGYGASYRLAQAGDGELIEDGELGNLGWVLRTRAGLVSGTNILANWWFPAVDDALGSIVVNPSYRRIVCTAELDQVVENDGRRTNLFALLKERGWLEGDMAGPTQAPGRWNEPDASAESRVRSYLHANCSVCHQPGGASRGNFDARLSTPLSETGLVGGQPLAGDLGIGGARIVMPGAPDKSLLYQRMKRSDFFRMPPVAYHDEPSPILPVMETWIRSLNPGP
jgi:glucose/arabinose dehydrogenase